MIYTFKCSRGHTDQFSRSMAEGPYDDGFPCDSCGSPMARDWKADAPMIDTSGCKDHDDVEPSKRVLSAWDRGSPERTEHEFQEHIRSRRAEIKGAGGQNGSIKQTHSVPAHLYHGKIKESGDPRYWDDPKNLSKHTSCKVE